jgi:hypothetical protein
MGTRVTANRADQPGGGVYFVNTLDGTGDMRHTLSMGSGVISDNTAGGYGGGVLVTINRTGGTSNFEAGFEMSGTGTIRSNTASADAGVYLGEKAYLGMAVYAAVYQNNLVFMMPGSKITITGKLEAATAANIDGEYTAPTTLLYGDVSSHSNASRFLYKGATGRFNSSGELTP